VIWFDLCACFVDFVLEYCGGGNLLRHKTVLNARSAVKQLIQGIKYLHAAGILHRDIKPENLLLVEEESLVKIADFGSALIVGNASSSITMTQHQLLSAELNAFAGTPEYLSPELLQSQLTLETATALDWWAVGCTAYWILTKGKILFEAATEYLVYKSIEQGLHPSVVRECCEADELLGEIIVGLLERSVRRRLDFVRERLDELLRDLDA
jgi:serine/threonine protein kinase